MSGFCWPPPCPSLVRTDAAGSYSDWADSCSGFGNSDCSLAAPGNDCRLAFGWGQWFGTSGWCWHCKRFEKQGEDTGNWVIEEWVGVEEEGVSLRWSGCGVAVG